MTDLESACHEDSEIPPLHAKFDAILAYIFETKYI